MKERLKELIPEFGLIGDESLRDKVIGVWIDAMKGGGWEIEDLEKIPFTLLIPDCPANFIEHTRGVVQVSHGAAKIMTGLYGKRLPLSMDYLVAGALLHDIGKLLEYERKDGKYVQSKCGKALRHPFSGLGIAFGKGIPDEVLHMIATHAKEGDLGKRSPESHIIHHADFTNFESLKAYIESGR
ncbi:MAG: HD domain-containing protein [Candidatus Eremiobacteraeota bacterium]|nr:HD domain-containing protein [Candidatus Eremiobacteraeota bacterium]